MQLSGKAKRELSCTVVRVTPKPITSYRSALEASTDVSAVALLPLVAAQGAFKAYAECTYNVVGP